MEKNLIDKVIDALLIVAIPVALYFAFIYAPLEVSMREVQKIFYFHVASAWIGFGALFITFIFSIVFLIKKNHFSDDVASASAELGLLFCTIVLITGPIWAKKAWGHWWTWDPRLTTTTILWFIYAAYALLRKFIDEPEKRAKFSAILGIIGFFDVPIVFLSIRWWRSMHPNVLQKGGGGMHPDMLTALFVALGAFTILYIALLRKRIRLSRVERKYYEQERI